MPIHDWSRVFSGTFHDFHSSWITHLKEILNQGVLPDGYFALAEQHATEMIPDVLTLSTRGEEPFGDVDGAVALIESPPKVSLHEFLDEEAAYLLSRRTIAIRHRSNRRLVAMIEIVSPGNKDGEVHLDEFVEKAVTALRNGVHLLIVDLHSPGNHDPHGIHGAVWQALGSRNYRQPEDRPLTLVSYMAEKRRPEAFVEPVSVGQTLPDMPLFLAVGYYVPVPLERTYAAAYRGVPSIIRDVLEGRAPPEGEE